jgi:glycosyltransferase involved in cell wall biosynthesis
MNNITLINGVDPNETIKYYNLSRVYSSVSYYEGMPTTCLEAMSCGLPVVVWDLSFYKGVVINSNNGYKILQDDLISFSKKVITILNNRETLERFSNSSIKIIKEKYSWTKISKEIVQVLKNESKK